jgi:hypothetical protein
VPESSEEPDRAALIDLLGALAYAELSAFDRLADDGRMAPTLAARAKMSAMATIEFGHHQQLVARLRSMDVDPDTAMEPFVAALETYHSLTEPSTWLEGVVKAYLGDGLAADFYREVAIFVDESTRTLIDEVLTDGGRADFAVREVRGAIEADPSISGRLALWARRLVGEAISQTQHVLADRDALMLLLVSGTGDLAGVGRMITRITEGHESRMAALGLKS